MKDNDIRKTVAAVKNICFRVPTEVLERTCIREGDSVGDWSILLNHWIDLYYSLTEAYETRDLERNIVFREFFVLLRNLMWHATAVMSGAYESAARELRYILEDICQAFYLAQEYSSYQVEQIYDIVRETRPPRGRALIHTLRLPSKLKNDMKETMTALHSYVHPSYEQMMENAEDLKVVFFHKHEWFEKVRHLQRKVGDYVLCIILWVFPRARPVFMSRPYVKGDLESMGFSHTLHTTPSE